MQQNRAKENYSGKKKQHTSKILVLSDENKFMSLITPVYIGKSHDLRIFKVEKMFDLLPPKIPLYTDTGFEGIDKVRDDLNIRKPKKKRKKRNLNRGEQLGNTIISRERVKVEHKKGGVKRYKIASTIFRGITYSMNVVFEICCGLSNHHIRMTQEV